MTTDPFLEEDFRVLTPEAFEFVLTNELKRAVRSQNYVTLVLLEPAVHLPLEFRAREQPLESVGLGNQLAAQDFEFYGKHLRGAKEMKPRWKRCVALVDGQLGEPNATSGLRTAVTLPERVVMVAVGTRHTCALDEEPGHHVAREGTVEGDLLELPLHTAPQAAGRAGASDWRA